MIVLFQYMKHTFVILPCNSLALVNWITSNLLCTRDSLFLLNYVGATYISAAFRPLDTGVDC